MYINSFHMLLAVFVQFLLKQLAPAFVAFLQVLHQPQSRTAIDESGLEDVATDNSSALQRSYSLDDINRVQVQVFIDTLAA